MTLKSALFDYYGRSVLAIYVIAQIMAEDPEGFVAEIHLRFNVDDPE